MCVELARSVAPKLLVAFSMIIYMSRHLDHCQQRFCARVLSGKVHEAQQYDVLAVVCELQDQADQCT